MSRMALNVLRRRRVLLGSVIITLLYLFPINIYAQGGYQSSTLFRAGMGIAGANVAICQPLATTAASVTSNVATLTMATNPITAGYAQGMTILVAGFSGADTYFNGGILSGFTYQIITGGYTILSVTPTTINYTLVHGNASASSNGTVLQIGNSTTSCGGLSTTYTNSSLATPATNPSTTDGYGNYFFWVPPGQYYVQFYGPTVTTSLTFAAIACVPLNSTNCGALLGSNNVWTGTQTFSLGVTFSTTTTFNGNATFNSNITAESINPLAPGSYTLGAAGGSWLNIYLGTGAGADTQLSSAATAHRLVAIPDGSGTLPLLSLVQSWTATQNFLNITTNNILPNAAATYNVGSAPLPYFNVFIGGAANTTTALASNATANRTYTYPDFSGMAEVVIGSGTTALGVGVLGGAGCEATITVVSAAVTTASRIVWNYATDPSAVAGYGGVPIDAIHVLAWPTAGNVNFKQCSAVAVTPGAISILWNAIN